MEAVRPDYDGAWIGGITPAVLAGGSAGWLPAPVRDAAGVLLLVCDGLGWELLQAGAAVAPTLTAMAGGPITGVVPSTTSAGLTSIVTGATPAEHGLVGYRIRVGGEPLNVLRWPTRGGPDPEKVQPIVPFAGRDIAVVTRAEFRASGFTQAHLRGTTLVGWRTTSALVEHCRRLAAGDRTFVYAYYDGIDKVAHEYGLRSEFITAELAATDRLVAELLDVLPDSWALLVTADHGQVHVEADDVIALDAVAPMVSAYAGEGRFRTLHARPGAAADLTAAACDAYGRDAWVLTREQLFDEGWLGARGSLDVRGRVGDIALAARSDVIFLDPDLPLEAAMRSHHGSLTAAEVCVPLLGARGRA
jgi:hypothetical protein